MHKYVLPPRVKLANNLLLFYLVLSALVSAYVAIISPLYIVVLLVRAGRAVAVFFKWPMACSDVFLLLRPRFVFAWGASDRIRILCADAMAGLLHQEQSVPAPRRCCGR